MLESPQIVQAHMCNVDVKQGFLSCFFVLITSGLKIIVKIYDRLEITGMTALNQRSNTKQPCRASTKQLLEGKGHWLMHIRIRYLTFVISCTSLRSVAYSFWHWKSHPPDFVYLSESTSEKHNPFDVLAGTMDIILHIYALLKHTIVCLAGC